MQSPVSATFRGCLAASMAAGAAPPRPLVRVTPAANALPNHEPLTKRLVTALGAVLGAGNVVEVEPTMVFEDYAATPRAAIRVETTELLEFLRD